MAEHSDLSAQPESDRNLEPTIIAAKSGDREALESLIESCRGYLLSIANQELDDVLQPKVGSSDVVQETCIKAVAKFDTFQGGSQPEFFGWMRQILLNNMIDTRRQYLGTDRRNIQREVAGSVARNLTEGLREEFLTPSSAASFDEQVGAMRHALEALPEDYRQVIMLRNWERLTFAEIGDRMNRSEEATRKLWTRAVLKLGDEL